MTRQEHSLVTLLCLFLGVAIACAATGCAPDRHRDMDWGR
jgi:hypothetical protein